MIVLLSFSCEGRKNVDELIRRAHSSQDFPYAHSDKRIVGLG